MKVFLILWVCIQAPLITLEESCFQDINYERSYDSVEECRAEFHKLTSNVVTKKDIYVTMFCTTKNMQKV